MKLKTKYNKTNQHGSLKASRQKRAALLTPSYFRRYIFVINKKYFKVKTTSIYPPILFSLFGASKKVPDKNDSCKPTASATMVPAKRSKSIKIGCYLKTSPLQPAKASAEKNMV